MCSVLIPVLKDESSSMIIKKTTHTQSRKCAEFQIRTILLALHPSMVLLELISSSHAGNTPCTGLRSVTQRAHTRAGTHTLFNVTPSGNLDSQGNRRKHERTRKPHIEWPWGNSTNHSASVWPGMNPIISCMRNCTRTHTHAQGEKWFDLENEIILKFCAS